MDSQRYADFLAGKVVRVNQAGIEATPADINPILFPFQRDCVIWALKLGKAALFQECGLGKTFQQLEWGRYVAEHTGGKVLILAPLAVAHQTIAEGIKLGLTVHYSRSQADADANPARLIVANYEMLEHFEPGHFDGVVLDESSILKAFTGKTKRMILDAFEHTPFKLACTATPAPNDHLELGNHAEFLNVMDSNEMISRWFINDSMQAGNYRLKGHARADFWRWITSWAVCISKPSDLGDYEDNGFILPNLIIHENSVSVDNHRAFEAGRLFLDANLSATNMWAEKRATAGDRSDRALEIAGQKPDEPWIIWCDTNYEADELKRRFPEAVEVRGSDSIKEKEAGLTAFSDGRARIIITKPDIAGFGLNWQHCANQIFVGVTYSFEKTYQALRRSWRYGQANPVNAYLIYADSESGIYSTLKEKQAAHTMMQEEMSAAMKKHGLFRGSNRLELTDAESEVATGHDWELRLGDCVQETMKLADNSIDFSIFSPPFSTLYIYSDSIADMGNTADDEEFFEHFEFLIPELHRVTVPGRLCAVHCKDLPLYKNRDGAAGLRDFPGEIIRRFEKHGWTYHSRVTIWKDPVIEMQRTKNHGLLYKNFQVRGEVCRQGMADYVIVFRKWQGVDITTSPKPIIHSRVEFPLEVWQRYASPVWFDIDQTNVLNFDIARDSQDEKHICPLQLDVIQRCIELWTNPGDVVLSPFAGVGSEGYVTLKNGRKFIGIELKRSYWQLAQRYLKEVEAQGIDMFTYAGIEVAS